MHTMAIALEFQAPHDNSRELVPNSARFHPYDRLKLILDQFGREFLGYPIKVLLIGPQALL